MKILNRLTIKHLKMNPKRTIVTIMGIVLSMALMLGCGLLASSFIEAMKTDTIRDQGAHHVTFLDITKEQAQMIENNLNVEDSYFYSTIGFAPFEDSINSSKPYYYIAGGSSKFFDHMEFVEGRAPENENEIVISDHISANGGKNIHVGDILTLNVGSRLYDGEIIYQNKNYDEAIPDQIIQTKEKKYKVVGIIHRSYTEDFTAAGYSLFTMNNTYSDNNFLLIQFKKPKDAFQIGQDMTEYIGLDASKLDYNTSLLYYYGATKYSNVNQSILEVLCIALGLLSVGCIIVIYNSFAISTMERKKQFGLYASIGATKRQILHTVFFEAFVVGTIGISLGIIGSFVGIYIVLQILNYLLSSVWNYHFELVLNWIYILIPIFFMVLVIFFSAFIPAKRASKVSPIVAIRENDDIKMPRRKLRSPKFITWIFGIEGELAFKNMKRNKRKYRITVLSLFISIVLFLSFSAYLGYGVSSMNSLDRYSYDIEVSSYRETNIVDQLKEIQTDARVDRSSIFFLDFVFIPFEPSYYVSAYENYKKTMNSPVETVNLYVLSDSDFLEYATQVSASPQSVLLVNHGQIISYKNNERYSYQGKIFQKEFSEFKVCQEHITENENAEPTYDCNNIVSNVKQVSEAPELFQHLSYDNQIVAFVSESTYQTVFEPISILKNKYYSLFIRSKEYEELYQSLSKQNSYLNVFSPQIIYQEEKNMVLAIKILLYGFISLVTLIGVTSVFNTIHTSINLRRKEFAMLRSMGLTPNGFNKMILFESLFFGLKSLVFGLPVSFGFILLIHNSMSGFGERDRLLIPWTAVMIAILGVFIVVLLAMGYSVHKIKKENILNAIRDENI